VLFVVDVEKGIATSFDDDEDDQQLYGKVGEPLWMRPVVNDSNTGSNIVMTLVYKVPFAA